MESELTPQVEKLIEKINAIPDKDKVFYGYYAGAYDHELIDLCSGSDLKALAARDTGEDELNVALDKTHRRRLNAECERDNLQSQLTTALDRVREYENFVARMEYAQFEGDYLIDVKDGEGFVLIANPDEDHRTTIGAYDTALEAFQAMVDGRE